MARIRSIHPGLASDEAFMSMSIAAKAAWPMLWTECDDHGIFEWKPIVLKARIFPADNIDFASLLDEWQQLGCVMMVEVDGKAYGLVRNFCRYQRPKSPSYRFPMKDEFRSFLGIKDENPEPVEDDHPSTPPEPPQPSPSPTENPPQRKEEGGRMEDEEGSKQTRAPAGELRKAIVQAFEAANSPNLPDTSRAELWLSQGYDAAIVAAVVKTCVARKPDITTLSYFDRAIREAHEQKRPPSAKPIEIDWPSIASNFARFGHWPGKLGPEPGYPGCRCPRDALEKHGIDPETGQKRSVAASA